MTASDYVLIIGAVAGGIVLCINAYGTHYGRKEAKEAASEAKAARHEASDKLDVIHDLTNSSMTALKAELATALSRIARLEDLLEAARERRATDRKTTGDSAA